MSRRGLSLPLNEETLATFALRKNLSYHHNASITSLDFNDSGQFLILAGVDKSIQVYDCHKGTHHKDVQSQKYGAHLARFTHSDLNCLYASTPVVDTEGPPDHSIRYLSLVTKSYLRYFKGHSEQVLSLEVNPVNETFVSSAADHTVKLWDTRTPSASGSMVTGQNSLVGYDPHGIVFAVANGPIGSEEGTVHLYDVGTYERGPFSRFKISRLGDEKWTKVEFSNNGKYILVATDSLHHYVLDAFLGKVIARLDAGRPGKIAGEYPSSATACFTPDGKHVFAAGDDSSVLFYDISAIKDAGGRPEGVGPTWEFRSSVPGISRVVAFNPKLLLFATADNLVMLWTPEEVS